MPFSVLSHLLFVERHRQRITRSVTSAGFATPAMGEIDLRPEDEGPMLASNMRGTFLLTRKSRENIARYGFSPCPPEDEGVLATELVRVLEMLSDAHGWGIRCRGVAEAVESLRGSGLVPRTIVVSTALARTALGQETPVEGFLGTVAHAAPNRVLGDGSGDMQVLVTNFPENIALVALAPVKAGWCVRSGDNLGMLVRLQAFRVVRT
jgi:hypothetical protein